MSESFFKLIGLALLSAMLVTLLRKWGSDLAVLLKLSAGVALAAACILALSPMLEYIRELCAISEGLPWESVETMLGVLAVAMVTHVCANICRDCGEATLGGYLELGGKVEIIVLILPMIRDIVEITVGIL
jgi:stage III sporulation protein AD